MFRVYRTRLATKYWAREMTRELILNLEA